MIDIQERLNEALRQYRHNTGGDELVPGYDLQMIAKLAEDLEAERKTMAAAVQQVAQEMRERKVNHGKDTSPTLHAWADRLSLACDDSWKQREALDSKPRRELLELAESCGAYLTGKPDGSEAITVVFPVSAWWAFDLATQLAPAQTEQQRPTAYPHEAMDKLAADRYRVGAAGAGTLHGFAVRAGDGEQELYRGSKSDCEHVARKLAGAFLDGGFTAFERYAAPIAQTAPQHPDDEAVDRFAVAMKAKLAASREKGRHGWQSATAPHLSALLYDHMYKADPLDVGNLAMMLHQNGQAIELPQEGRGRRRTAPQQAEPVEQANPLRYKDDPRTPVELSNAGCRCVRFGEGNPHWPCSIHTAPPQDEQEEDQHDNNTR